MTDTEAIQLLREIAVARGPAGLPHRDIYGVARTVTLDDVFTHDRAEALLDALDRLERNKAVRLWGEQPVYIDLFESG